MAYRQQFGRMNSFILDSLRGLQEILQYGRQKERLEELKRESGTLAKENAQLKRHEGDSAAACGACISLFSFAMLFLSLWLNPRQLKFFRYGPGYSIHDEFLRTGYGPV